MLTSILRQERDVERKNLQERIEAARSIQMTPEAKERQRRSFAFGNTHIENDRITKATIDRAAEQLSANDIADGTRH